MKRLEVSTRKTFIRFLVSYVIILFIPIIIGAIAYNIAFHTVEDAVIQSNTMLLGQSMRVLDRRLAEMDSLVEQLLWTPEVKSFSYITKPFEGSQVCRIIDTKKAIYSYSISNNFIEGYYLLFKNSNMVLTPNIIYTIPSFYKNYLTYENIDYKKWYNMILGKYCYKEYLPSMSVNLNGKKYSMITYVQSLGYGTYYNGAVMVLINSNEIEKLFSDIDISDGGCIYIADQNDHIIVQIGSNEASLITLKGLDKVAGVKKQSINGKNMLITYVTSKYNGWKYVTVQPIHIVMERLLYVKKVTAYIVLMSLILGIIAAYFWAYKNNMPIKLIVKMIKDKFSIENHESSNAYELIQSTITDLISKNNVLQASMEEQIPFLKAAFFERLLKGDIYVKDQINAIMQYIGVDLSGRFYTVILMHLRGYYGIANKNILTELDQKKVVVKDIVYKTIENIRGKVYLHDIKEDKIALILACDSIEMETYRNALNKFCYLVRKDLEPLGIDIAFAIGNTYENVLDVSRSYEQAQWALNTNVNDWIVWYDAIPLEGNYYYPIDLENKLINLAKIGNRDEVDKILDELYNENIVKRHLSSCYITMFMNELCGSIIKVTEQIKINDDNIKVRVLDLIKDINLGSSNNIKELYVAIVEVYHIICDFVYDQKKSHNARLIDSIINYLQASYFNPNLCLSMVAEKFNLSQVYLSQFFKEQTGENFSDFVESIRIEQAKKLLLTEELTIAEIANKVGYSSTNTFCRTFKRVNGMSATEYKKLVHLKSFS